MNDAEEIRERGEALRRLAQSLEGKPVVWGPDGDDCSQLPLQWVVGWRERMTGIAPDVDGPDYSTEEESLALIAKAGGLVNLWEPICRQLGMDPLGPADIPVVGDVGIINIGRKGVDGAFLQSGGIFLHGGLFMWRAEASWATLDALGRTFPRRTPNGWQKVPVIAKAWRLA